MMSKEERRNELIEPLGSGATLVNVLGAIMMVLPMAMIYATVFGVYGLYKGAYMVYWNMGHRNGLKGEWTFNPPNTEVSHGGSRCDY